MEAARAKKLAEVEAALRETSEAHTTLVDEAAVEGIDIPLLRHVWTERNRGRDVVGGVKGSVSYDPPPGAVTLG